MPNACESHIKIKAALPLSHLLFSRSTKRKTLPVKCWLKWNSVLPFWPFMLFRSFPSSYMSVGKVIYEILSSLRSCGLGILTHRPKPHRAISLNTGLRKPERQCFGSPSIMNPENQVQVCWEQEGNKNLDCLGFPWGLGWETLPWRRGGGGLKNSSCIFCKCFLRNNVEKQGQQADAVWHLSGTKAVFITLIFSTVFHTLR